MTYKVEFLPRADLDLMLVDLYLSQYYPSTSAKFFSGLEKKLRHLTQMPKKFPLYPDTESTRKLVVGDFIVLYRVMEDAGRVEVLRVLHGARDIQRLIENNLTETN